MDQLKNLLSHSPECHLTTLSVAPKGQCQGCTSLPGADHGGQKSTLWPTEDIHTADWSASPHSSFPAWTVRQEHSCSRITRKLFITCELSDPQLCVRERRVLAWVMLTPLVLTFACVSPQEENFFLLMCQSLGDGKKKFPFCRHSLPSLGTSIVFSLVINDNN